MQFDWLPVTRFEQNCSMLWCERTRRAVVIDPGGGVDQIQDMLAAAGLTLEVVLLTHGHFDHAGAAAELAAACGVRIEGPHRDEEALIGRMIAGAARHGIRAQSFTPARWLTDGDQVRFGDEVLDVLHCPGHTRGHVAYFHAGNKVAFVGDILFLHAVGAWEHVDGDLGQLVTSIRTKLFPLGDDVSFLPGHGEMSTFGHERAANPFVGDEAIARWWPRFQRRQARLKERQERS